ncbi:MULTISPECIES: hypothetical protein [unclassified Moorena]|uniref:hypothetical protein n=1 Tax=unclassified Moorena TaxID=2683338 RepID=UPI0025E2FB55|nr:MULTISPECIES: hypothetical protein [unclassified Moorena]
MHSVFFATILEENLRADLGIKKTLMKKLLITLLVALCLVTTLFLTSPATALAKTTLYPGEELKRGDFITSPNGQYKFIQQEDGNLVLYNGSGLPLWANGQHGKAVSRTIMQDDGNFVTYGYPEALWSSGTSGSLGAYLMLQDDGNIVIYQPHPDPIWTTNTVE